jgi:tetratricopeptide (TPR) repeat protein
MSTLGEVVQLFMDGRDEDARRACRKLLKAEPALPQAHLLLAEISRKLGDEGTARDELARTLRLQPGWTEAHAHAAIADLFMEHRRYDDAEPGYRRALALSPALHEAREQLLRMLLAQHRYDELEAASREAMALFPDAAFYPERLGIAHWRRGRYEEGLAAFRIAVERAPGPASEAHLSARLHLANALLMLGRLGEGWVEYQWRHTRVARHSQHPELLDQPASVAANATPRRIRIVAEQGFGDDLFFLRFAPALRRRGHELAMSCDDKLAPLLSRMPQVLQHVNPRDFVPDITLCSGDLPLASGEDMAPPLPLPVDAARRARWAARLQAFGPPPYIGVSWRAGILPQDVQPTQGAYWVKDVSPERLGQTLRGLDVRVVVLQRRPAGEDLAAFRHGLGRGALDLSEVNDDLQDALAVLSLLDDYVGVSNTNVHLRVGIPGAGARVLVRTPTEWRWSGGPESSRWFPGVRVYRDVPGQDWAAALAALEGDLRGVFAA